MTIFRATWAALLLGGVACSPNSLSGRGAFPVDSAAAFSVVKPNVVINLNRSSSTATACTDLEVLLGKSDGGYSDGGLSVSTVLSISLTNLNLGTVETGNYPIGVLQGVSASLTLNGLPDGGLPYAVGVDGGVTLTEVGSTYAGSFSTYLYAPGIPAGTAVGLLTGSFSAPACNL